MKPRAPSTSAEHTTEPGRERRPTVLIIAYHFAPDNASGTHRSLHFARSLHEAGYSVHVLTAPVDHAATVDYTLSAVFPHEDRIVRVPKRQTMGELYLRIKDRLARRGDPAAGGSDRESSSNDPEAAEPESRPGLIRYTLRQFAAFDTFPDAHRGWYRPALSAGLRLGRQVGVDGVFASGPPWTGVLVAAKLARKLGCALLADFRDPWTENTGRQTPYETEWSHRWAKRCERDVLSRAKLALFNSPAIERAARDSYPTVDSSHFQTIVNGSDAPRRESKRPLPRTGQLRLRHFGTLYRGRSVLPLIQSLRHLLEQGRIAPGEVAVELIGRCSAENADLTAAGIDGIPIRHKEKLPYREALALMSEPSVLLVVQPGNLNVQIPTKLYDYLCTGNPVLVMATEESATWSMASGFARCHRLEPEGSQYNVRVLEKMIGQWRAGELVQEASATDTQELKKDYLGRQFVQAVTEALALGR